jgi:multicomponent Na+:H+ antiporter subunit E
VLGNVVGCKSSGELRDAGGILLTRAVIFFAIWLSITGWQPENILIGVAATVASTVVSLAISPRLGPQIRLGSLAALIVSFLGGSIVAGIDVARRALAPELNLRPGFVSFALRLPEGFARNAFSALSSLQPGALPTGADDGALIVHAIDVTRPVQQALAADEELFMRVFGYE